jgi:2-oxoisovalerate dehydrogenase E1 component
MQVEAIREVQESVAEKTSKQRVAKSEPVAKQASKTKASVKKAVKLRQSPAKLDKKIGLSLYREMLKIRRTEEQLARSYQAGLIPGACHTYIGEEAIATAVCAHLRDDDAVFSTHRGHGHALAKGVPIREVIAELYGKATGCSQGRGGSMHLFKPEVGMMGTSGIVGPCILQATGAAYSFKLRETDQLGVAFFGDGAVSNGAFHEGLTMAARWQLPALYICENNLYATEVAFSTATQNPQVANRGDAYGMTAVALDGNDVVAIHAAAREAAERARAGGGPTLIECRTYRTRAHAEGMRDAGYRTHEEIDAWKAKDPIDRLGSRLIADKLASKKDLEAIDADLRAEVAAGVTFAEESPWPDPATVTDHVFNEAVGSDA